MATNTRTKVIALKEIPIASIKPAKYNPRSIDKKSYEALKASIRQFGQRENLILNKDLTLISGHVRLDAMRELGHKTAWCDIVDLSKADEKKLNLIMNSPLLQGRFDMLKVDSLLKELHMSKDLESLRLPELGKLELRKPQVNLAKIFIVPPYSVLDTKTALWQQRKRYWVDKIGDQAETRQHARTFVRQEGENYLNKKIAKIGNTSILDPVLAEILCYWFGLAGGKTFDPFAGDTVFGYVAASAGLQFTGIELRKDQAELNQRRLKKDKLAGKYICDDAANLDKHIKDESQDFIFSCPPYADQEVYSDLAGDLSNMNHADFFNAYQDVLTKLYKKLKPNRFCVLVVSEVRNHYKEFIGLVPKTIDFMQQAGFLYYNEIILLNAFGSLPLRVRRFMNTRKVGRTHQNVLVFYKGDMREIKNIYPELVELKELKAGNNENNNL